MTAILTLTALNALAEPGGIVSNPARAGSQESRPFAYVPGTGGRSTTGGISYIDQEAGGVTQPRTDGFAGAITGPVGAQPRDFTRPGIHSGLIAGERVQGDVGRSSAQHATAVRATTQRASNVPDNGDVIAAFTSPALGNLIRRMRGQ